MKSSSDTLRRQARAIWQAGVDAVLPDRLMESAVVASRQWLHVGPLKLPLDKIRSIAVIGAGKAGAGMSQALERSLGSALMRDKQLRGCVNVPDRTVVPLERIHLHPARSAPDNKPTEAGVVGAGRIRELVESLGPGDLAICLLSGGGSALLPAPVSGVSLADKQAVTSLLHASGATINEMNAVRKHLSELKGGELVRRFRGGWLVSLIISYVVGDPLDVIASGPTAPDRSTFADALAVLDKYDLTSRVPPSVREHLMAGAAGKRPETLKRLPSNVYNHIIGNNGTALRAAERKARQLGFRTINLSSFIEGDSEQVGIVLAGIARGVRERHEPASPPLCLLSGGETTVSLSEKHGLGGRNQQLVLAAAHHLGDGMEGMVVLSGGTDGEDGPTDAAGAWADSKLMKLASRRGLDPREFLSRHDAYHFFEPLRGLIQTGLTNTNVMDLRVLLVDPAAALGSLPKRAGDARRRGR